MVKKNPQFKEGEIVVYPKHGVGEVIKIETMEIESIKTNHEQSFFEMALIEMADRPSHL